MNQTNTRTIGVYEGPLEFRSWVMSLGCPARIVDAVAAKNKRDAVQIAARKAALDVERRSGDHAPVLNVARLTRLTDADVRSAARRLAEDEDTERDARRRRMMAAII